MHLLCSFVSLLLSALLQEASMCIESDVCTCEGMLLSCICDERQDISLHSMIHFDVSDVKVQRCGIVDIPFLGMSYLSLIQVEFIDIVKLRVGALAMTGIQSLNSLRLIDISELEVENHGFSSLSNVTTVEIRNVTSYNLKMAAFGGLSDIGNFIISDSVFETVEPFAIILTNVTSFEVSNTRFGSLQNMSLAVLNGYEVSFTACSIASTDNGSFSLSYVDKLTFRNCSFGILSTEAIQTKNLKTFTFTTSVVKEIEANAFQYVDVTDYVFFADNIIQKAGNNSLFPCYGPYEVANKDHLVIEMAHNQFNCNCDLSWLWEETGYYDILLNTSTCIGSPEMQLSSLSRVANEKNECLKLHLKSTETFFNVTDEYEEDTTSVNSTDMSLSIDDNYNSSVGTIDFNKIKLVSASKIPEFSLILLVGCCLVILIFSGYQER